MIDQTSSEELDIFREALLLTTLGTNLRSIFDDLEADISRVKAGTMSATQIQALSQYRSFEVEAQRKFMEAEQMRPGISAQAFAEAAMREVRSYMQNHSLAEITSADCTSTGMKLFCRFVRWQRADGREL